MTRKPRTTLSGYFKEISRRLQAQVEVMTPVISHRGEMGDNDHEWFAKLLRRYMPNRIGIDTGFVVNFESDARCRDGSEQEISGGDNGIGPQSDILLVDVLENAPLCSEESFRVCPVEMVLGVIEITRKLDAAKLAEDLEKIARVRALGAPDKKRYGTLSRDAARRLRPRAYLVGLKSSVSFEQIRQQVAAMEDDLRPNAVALLDKALYVRRPFTVDFYEVTEDVLFQFLAVLRLQTESFPLGTTDLRAYVPAVASLLSEQDYRCDSSESLQAGAATTRAFQELNDEELESGS